MHEFKYGEHSTFLEKRNKNGKLRDTTVTAVYFHITFRIGSEITGAANDTPQAVGVVSMVQRYATPDTQGGSAAGAFCLQFSGIF